MEVVFDENDWIMKIRICKAKYNLYCILSAHSWSNYIFRETLFQKSWVIFDPVITVRASKTDFALGFFDPTYARIAWDGLIEKAEKLTKIKLEKAAVKKSANVCKGEQHESEEKVHHQKIDGDCNFDGDCCVDTKLVDLSQPENLCDDRFEIETPELEENQQECQDPDAY